jgi:hypothetical protein
MKWTALTLVCLVTACSSTPPQEPRVASATGFGSSPTDLNKYRTFMFGPANPPVDGYQTTERSLEVQRRIMPLVEASLAQRGYAPGQQDADLVIKISTGSGTLPGDGVQRGNASAQTAAGFIGIDAYDRATGSAVWHGTAFAEINPELIDNALLARGVERMLADFPKRSPASGQSVSSLEH